MKQHIFTWLLLLGVVSAYAQDKDKLFGGALVPKSRHGVLISISGNADLPAADMAKRFGGSFRIGPDILYKTTSNWLIGAKCDFIFGNDIKQDSLMINIRDKYSGQSSNLYEFINGSGERVGVPVYERGYLIGLQVGKIISLTKNHPDDGITVIGSAGFIQHKIDIYNTNKDVPALQGDYLKGYDRLTNGLFVEGYAGYTHIDRHLLLNYTIGVDAMFGFTQGRRDYLYDVMHADTNQRLDILFGLRGGWFIPIFKRKSEDIMFK